MSISTLFDIMLAGDKCAKKPYKENKNKRCFSAFATPIYWLL